MRFHQLGAPDYWLDELHSLSNSAGSRAELEALPHGVLLDAAPRFTELTPQSSWPVVWSTMRHDGHPPLYFLLLLTWRRLVGDGESAVRGLSAALSVLSILPAALLVKELGRARLVPWTALILAVSYAHVIMAQQNRPYALSLLLVTTASWLLLRMERKGVADPPSLRGFDAAMYGLALWLAVLTHYFTVPALAAHGVYAALRFRGRLLTFWLAAAIAAGAAWVLIWGGAFLAQQEFIAIQDWLREDRPDHPARSVLRFLDLPVRLLFDHEAFAVTSGKALTGTAVLAAIAVVAIRRRMHAALLAALWFLCPAVTFLCIDLLNGRQMLSHLRYMSVAAPGLVILLVIVAGEAPNVVRAGLAGTCLLAAALTLNLPTPQNPHSREAAAILIQRVQPGEPVIYDAVDWPRFWASSMYLTVNYYLPRPLTPVAVLREAPGAELRKRLEDAPRIHVVSPRVKVDVNPLPERCARTFKSAHVEGIGWIYTFECERASSE